MNLLALGRAAFLEEIVGWTEEAVRDRYGGGPVRITKRDNEYLLITMDNRVNRLNLWVEAGLVTRAWYG